MEYIVVNVLCALENNVNALVGCSGLYTSISSNHLIVFFKSIICTDIFGCLLVMRKVFLDFQLCGLIFLILSVLTLYICYNITLLCMKNLRLCLLLKSPFNHKISLLLVIMFALSLLCIILT